MIVTPIKRSGPNSILKPNHHKPGLDVFIQPTICYVANLHWPINSATRTRDSDSQRNASSSSSILNAKPKICNFFGSS